MRFNQILSIAMSALAIVATPHAMQADAPIVKGVKTNVSGLNFVQQSPAVEKYSKQATNNMTIRRVGTRAISENDGVYTDPQGVSNYYDKSAEAIVTQWGSTYVTYFDGLACQIIYGNNNDAYILNPFSGYPTATYLKGSIVDNEIVVQLPQKIGYDDYAGDLYAYRMVPQPEIIEGETWLQYVPDTQETTLRYFIKDDGSVKQYETSYYDSENIYPMVMLGLAIEDGTFAGMGDWNQEYDIHSETLVEVPDDIEFSRYALSCTYDDYFVNVAFAGNDVYIKGIYNGLPDGVIKGSLTDSHHITFASKQFLGLDKDFSFFAYVIGCNYDLVWNEDWQDYEEVVTPKDDFSCEIDQETGKIIISDYISISAYTDFIYGMSVIYKGSMTPQPMGTAYVNPCDPTYLYVQDYNDGTTMVIINIPKVDVNGMLFDYSQLYYRVYVDNEPFEFLPDAYACFDKPTTDIPYGLEDGIYFDVATQMHSFILDCSGWNKLGIQTVYKDGEQQLASNIVEYGESSVKDISTDSDILSIDYYDLTGKIVTNPSAGLYIRKCVLANGELIATKLLVK